MGNTEANERNSPALRHRPLRIEERAENPKEERKERTRKGPGAEGRRNEGWKVRRKEVLRDARATNSRERDEEESRGQLAHWKEKGREEKGTERKEAKRDSSSGAEPASSSFLAYPSSTSPPGDAHEHTTVNVVTLVRTRAHRGSYTRRHLNSPYLPYSSVRTTRLRTVYTTVRQGRGSALRQSARKGPPRVIPIASPSRLVLPCRFYPQRPLTTRPWTRSPAERSYRGIPRTSSEFDDVAERRPGAARKRLRREQCRRVHWRTRFKFYSYPRERVESMRTSWIARCR